MALTANEFCRYIYGKIERKEDGIGTDLDLWFTGRRNFNDVSSLSTFFYIVDIEKLGKNNCLTILYLTHYWIGQPMLDSFREKLKERYGLKLN